MYSDDDIKKIQSSKKVSQKKVNYNSNPVSNKKALDEPDEDFYDDFYRYEKRMEDEDNIEEEPDLETSGKKESRSKVGIVLLLLIILAVVGFLLIKSFTNKPPEETPNPIANISEELIEINENEDRKINYSFENFEDDPRANFVSSDENIATVNNEGVVHGVHEGETKVIISYFIKDVSYQKEVSVKVNHVDAPDPEPEPEPEPPKPTPQPTPTPTKDTTKPTLTINVTNGGDKWVNHDVVINVSGKDNSGKVTLRYALNCTNNCKYQNVSGGKITINSQGQTTVIIQAVDPSGNTVSKQAIVKIDKTAPTCSLKVSSDGTISSAIADNNGLISYFGFNSDYATDRTRNKKISSAGSYTYYVQDQAGNKGTCAINVKTKVQYRSRTCDASHKKFGSWYVRKQVYITSCGAYGKSEAERAGSNWYRTRSEVSSSNCSGQSPCYYCTAYARNITGCNWGSEAWGPYQDAEISSSTTVQVDKSTVYYQ